MIKNIGDNYKIYGLIIVKIAQKKLLMLNYVLSKATFEPPKHAFTPYAFTRYLFRVIFPKSTP